MNENDLFLYFGVIILIIAIISAVIYFFKKNKVLKTVLYISSFIALLYILGFAFVYYFFVYRPYKQLHADDDKYFGKYYFKAKSQNDTTILILDSNFTFRLLYKHNLPFLDSGRWIANNTDDYQFEFIKSDSEKFYAISEIDSVNSILKLHKKSYYDDFFIFKKIK